MSAAADNHNMLRLEQELTEIKGMLNDFSMRNKQQNAERITDMISKIEAEDHGAGQSLVPDSMMMSFNVEDGDGQT